MDMALLTYLYIVFGNIVHILQIFESVLFIITVIFIISIGIEFAASEGKSFIILTQLKKIKGVITKIFITYVISLIIVSLYPKKEDVQLIAGAYIIDMASELKGLNKLPENIVNAINKYLESVK